MHALTLRRLAGTEDEIGAAQRISEAAADYAERVTGLPPGEADGQSLFVALPEGKTYEDKYVFGVFVDGRMVGCADLIRRFPDESHAHLGLLLLEPAARGQGFGMAAYQALEAQARTWPECKALRLGVVETNLGALPFWQRAGFAETGETKPYRHASLESRVRILVKTLDE